MTAKITSKLTKPLTQVTVVLLLITSISTQCNHGCFFCNNDNKCTTCYNRPVLANGTCGEQHFPSDHCQVFAGPTIKSCQMCDSLYYSRPPKTEESGEFDSETENIGYALNLNNPNSRTCTLVNNMPRLCISATLLNGKVNCAFCAATWAPDRQGSCTAKSTLKACQWTGLNSDRSQRCFKCFGGYIANNKGVCVPPPAPYGCLV